MACGKQLILEQTKSTTGFALDSLSSTKRFVLIYESRRPMRHDMQILPVTIERQLVDPIFPLIPLQPEIATQQCTQTSRPAVRQKQWLRAERFMSSAVVALPHTPTDHPSDAKVNKTENNQLISDSSKGHETLLDTREETIIKQDCQSSQSANSGRKCQKSYGNYSLLEVGRSLRDREGANHRLGIAE